jgi:hypothetical protein
LAQNARAEKLAGHQAFMPEAVSKSQRRRSCIAGGMLWAEKRSWRSAEGQSYVVYNLLA